MIINDGKFVVDGKTYTLHLDSGAEWLELAPVVHAKWIKHWHNSLIGHEYEECSNCGCIISDTEKFWDCSYCPTCGALMK